MKALKTFLQFGLRLLALPVVFIFYLLRKYVVVEFVLPNVTLFGHLALEPEKVLSNIASQKSRSVGEPKRILIWSLGKSREQVNKALVKIWGASCLSCHRQLSMQCIGRASGCLILRCESCSLTNCMRMTMYLTVVSRTLNSHRLK